MTGHVEGTSLRNERWEEREEMFHGLTIRELTGLVEEVMRAHKSTVLPLEAAKRRESSHGLPTGTSR